MDDGGMDALHLYSNRKSKTRSRTSASEDCHFLLRQSLVVYPWAVSHSAGHKLTVLLLILPPECWYYRHVSFSGRKLIKVKVGIY